MTDSKDRIKQIYNDVILALPEDASPIDVVVALGMAMTFVLAMMPDHAMRDDLAKDAAEMLCPTLAEVVSEDTRRKLH